MNESGIRGKSNIINTAKIIASTIPNIRTDGINITMITAKITSAKYAARYPPRLVEGTDAVNRTGKLARSDPESEFRIIDYAVGTPLAVYRFKIVIFYPAGLS